MRLLGYDPQTQMPITLKLLQPGAIIGEIGLLRDVACETAIASTEVVCLTLSAAAYLRLFSSYPAFANSSSKPQLFGRSFRYSRFTIGKSKLTPLLNLKELTQKALPRCKSTLPTPRKNSI